MYLFTLYGCGEFAGLTPDCMCGLPLDLSDIPCPYAETVDKSPKLGRCTRQPDECAAENRGLSGAATASRCGEEQHSVKVALNESVKRPLIWGNVFTIVILNNRNSEPVPGGSNSSKFSA
ncbi:hypothetical protein Hamer_G012724 [Homarus americanus]|uniref:Uncharacterized protein n=1 Tax=Homarus americanus TaxID=6706 RepID=A0A8J5JR59_HOMAM|nr:hypothetical protein Hamer_G012724 [Homarus americanus]